MTKMPRKTEKIPPLYDVITSHDLNVCLSMRENTTQFLNFCITLQPNTDLMCNTAPNTAPDVHTIKNQAS